MRYTGRIPWDVLGVAEGAPFADVKRAYLQRARLTHPDAPGGSAEAFREVQAAFEALRASRDCRPAPPRPTPYDRWASRPPAGSRQWTDDDPLVAQHRAPVPRRASFAQILNAELRRRPHAA